MSNRRSKFRLTAVVLSVVGLGSSPVMAADCGPGAHWVDTCPAGIDILPNTRADITIEIPCGNSPGTFTLRGETNIDRQEGTTSPWVDPPSIPGTAPALADHHIHTEITLMDLTGDGLTLSVGNHLTIPSLGGIIELASDDMLAYSFFCVYFEIHNTPFGTLHNHDCHLLERIIPEVPPLLEIYFPPVDQIILLYDDSEVEQACISGSRHVVLVTLIDNSFTATASNGAVTIAWETASEIDNAGFFVWRGQLKADKTKCSLNGEDYTEVKKISPFILAQGSGTRYSHEDRQVASRNSYCYVLEDIDLADKSTFHLDDISSVQ